MKWHTIIELMIVIAVAGASIYGIVYGTMIYEAEPAKIQKAEGKHVFETEEDWGDFKRIIGRPDVKIKHLKEYASDPPIVAEYKLVLPASIDFPYGETTIPVYDPWQPGIGGAFLACVMIYSMFSLGPRILKWIITRSDTYQTEHKG